MGKYFCLVKILHFSVNKNKRGKRTSCSSADKANQERRAQVKHLVLSTREAQHFRKLCVLSTFSASYHYPSSFGKEAFSTFGLCHANHDEQEKTALDHSTAFLPAENQASLQMDEQPISLLKAVTLKIRNMLSELQEQFR